MATPRIQFTTTELCYDTLDALKKGELSRYVTETIMQRRELFLQAQEELVRHGISREDILYFIQVAAPHQLNYAGGIPADLVCFNPAKAREYGIGRNAFDDIILNKLGPLRVWLCDAIVRDVDLTVFQPRTSLEPA